MLDVIRCEKTVCALPEEHVEMVGPEVDHYLVQLALGDGGAHDRELGKLAGESATTLLERAGRLIGRRVGLALPPLPLRLDVQPRQVAAVVVEEAELALSRGAVAVGDLLGRELAV